MAARRIILASIACIGAVCAAPFSFDAFRALHMVRDGETFGSTKAALDLEAVAATTDASDLSRRVVVGRAQDMSTEKLEALMVEREAAALLLLMPPPAEGPIPDGVRTALDDVTDFFLSRSFPVPVYFAHEGDHLAMVRETLEATAASAGVKTQDGYRFSVTAKEPVAVPKLKSSNLQAMLLGKQGDGESEEAPTIAIVAHYDSMSVAPGLNGGTEGSATGAVAALELLRLFSALYAREDARPSFNLLFVLTGAGSLNYMGAREWIEKADPRVLDTLQLVLCLDGLGSGDVLRLHTPKKPKGERMQLLQRSFQSAAARLGVRFEWAHKKINLGDPALAWEHEAFAVRKVPAGTLSTREAPVRMEDGAALVDGRERADLDALLRNVRAIAEGLAQFVFPTLPSQSVEPASSGANAPRGVFEGSLGLNSVFVAAWLDSLASIPRPVHAMDETAVRLIDEMEKSIDRYATESSRQRFDVDSAYSFFGTHLASMSVYRVKPQTFDLFLLIGVLVYLFVFYVASRVGAKGVSVLSRPSELF